MTTITLKINEKSATGKALLTFIKSFINGTKGVEIVEEEKNRYNAETEKAIADVRARRDLTKVSLSEFRKQLQA